MNQVNEAGKNAAKSAKDTVDKGNHSIESIWNKNPLEAGDEIKNKGKQMKDSVADTANNAKDKINDGAQNVKDGAEKGPCLAEFLFILSFSFDSAAKNAKQTANDAADKVKDTAANVGTAVSDGLF